ncbi:aldehyde dehydrogenase family protein, partial [uncultured Nocardioides sp.]|uniref:aldehyde dehydrogenase family protein n=1 Tax=uncultured Nocardioides sp. TaxID=198441 RepID=UPI0025DFAFA1
MSSQSFRNVIDGELVDAVSGETYDVIDPSTGEVYASAPMSRAEDVDRAYAAADAAFEGWATATPQERARALLRIADAIDERAEEIVRVESRDTGKPIGLTASEELPPSSDHFRFFAGAARLLEGRSAGEYLADHTSF